MENEIYSTLDGGAITGSRKEPFDKKRLLFARKCEIIVPEGMKGHKKRRGTMDVLRLREK